MDAPHSCSVEECLRTLKSDPERGLASREALRRLSEVGKNRLEEAAGIHPVQLFLKQFADLMVLVLMGAGAVSFFLGEAIDAIAIAAILILNAVFGFVQEFRAEKALQALQRLTAPTTTVLRDGSLMTVAAEEIVPGDVLVVESGDRIPADGRIIWSMALEIDESPLTGESVPASKDHRHVGEVNEALGDRRNMAYMGTAVTRGRARLLVTGTAMATQIGEIAELIREKKDEATPLQVRLHQLGKGLVFVCILLVAAVFLAGVARGLPVYQMFLTGVSLAVAAIPEGLPAVVTAALAIGVQRMIRRKAIVRRLTSVETLGSATVICTDKTGTLTKNEMTVTRLFTARREIEVTGTGYQPDGEFRVAGKPWPAARDGDLVTALRIGALCNTAKLAPPEAGNAKKGSAKAWRVMGDPTEASLLIAAMKAGLDPRRLERQYALETEHPFEAQRRRMSVVVSQNGQLTSFVKGALDAVLPFCTHVLVDGERRPLTQRERTLFRRQMEAYANEALRVLALAYRPLRPGQTDQQSCESELTLVALAAMFDPPRGEVAHAVALSRRAGVRTVMLTGDHPATATAIGRAIRLLGVRDEALTGQDVEAMSDAELEATVARTSCFARVSPKHKLRIVQALRRRGEIVAMTGDGVNDAPAVKEADIGIAMGMTGADVTKEAAALVLADDNYATIVAAIEEGRGIYDNIRKFIRYLLSCNAGEVLAVLVAVLTGLPLPLLPLQILWMNLVTDGLPAIALGVDPPDKDAMTRPPRPASEGVFARRLPVRILFSGGLIAISTLLAFGAALTVRPDDLDWARTVAFTTLVTAQLLFAFMCRSERRSAVAAGLFANRYLVLAVAVSFAMQFAVIYWQPLAAAFRTVPLAMGDWLLVLACAGMLPVLDSLLHFVRNRVLRHLSMLRVSQSS